MSIVTSHNVLFDLPSDAIHSILSVWLDSEKSLSSLDIACCHSQMRESLKTTFSSPHFVMQIPTKLSNNKCFFSWLCSRNVKVERLDVAVELSAEFVAYVEMMGNPVKHLSIRSINLSKASNLQLFHTVMQSCPQLYALMMDSCSITKAVLETISTCFSLRDLRLHDNEDKYYDDDNTIRNIKYAQTLELATLIVPGHHLITGAILDSTSTSSLKVLELRLSHGLCADGLIKKLSPACNIEALCISADESGQLGNDALLSLLELCPTLQHLDFYCPYEFTGNITRMALTLTRLKSLRLNCCPYANELLLELAKLGCPALQALFLDQCRVEATGINAITAQCTLKTLRFDSIPNEELLKLELSTWEQLTSITVVFELGTEDFLDDISNYCPQVTYLGVGHGTTTIDAMYILHQIHAFFELRVLDIFAYRVLDLGPLQAVRPRVLATQHWNVHDHIFENVLSHADCFPYNVVVF